MRTPHDVAMDALEVALKWAKDGSVPWAACALEVFTAAMTLIVEDKRQPREEAT